MIAFSSFWSCFPFVPSLRSSLFCGGKFMAVGAQRYACFSYRGRHLHPVQKVDLAKFLLLLVGWFGISWMNIGGVSGYVRQETLVKLKILFTLLELLDRLMGNYGEHILGSLFWALEARPELVKRGIAWHALLALGYIGAAAAFLTPLTVLRRTSHSLARGASPLFSVRCRHERQEPSAADAVVARAVCRDEGSRGVISPPQSDVHQATAMKKISEPNLGSLCYEGTSFGLVLRCL